MRRFGALLVVLLITKSLFSLPTPTSSQDCQQNPRSQLETALDRSTNRILLREVVNDLGEDGKTMLVQLAGDDSQPFKRRAEAIRLLGEHRSEAGEQLLLEMLGDSKLKCLAINVLPEFQDPKLVPLFIQLLSEQQNCGKVSRFSTGGGRVQETDYFLSDAAVSALERLTGKRLEKETDLFVIGHRATQPWKDWWNENRSAFLTDPTKFMGPTRESNLRNDSYPCSVQTIAVSPDGKTAFSAGKSYDPWVRAWNIETRQQLWATPTIWDDDVNAAQFSPDGRIIAVGTANGAMKIYDAATGRRLRMLVIGSGVNSLAFSRGGDTLAASLNNGGILFFDTSTWCEKKRIENSDMTEGIAFSPDGSLLAAASFEQVRVWSVSAGTVLISFKIRPGKSPSVFMDEGERLAELWRMAWSVAFSPDGEVVATGSSSAVQLWNLQSGKEVSWSPSGGEVRSLHFSRDGRWVIWGNDNDQILKWNPETQKKQRTKNEFSLGDTAKTFDDTLILSPGASTEIAIFDLEKLRKVGVLACTKQKQ